MAQLKDLLVAGPSRFIGDMFGNTLQITKVLAPTTSGGSTYGAGSNNQVLRTNGASIYWGSNVTSNEVYMNWSNPTTPNTDKQINLTVNGATAGTIKFVAGSNVTLTATAGSPNTITIASSYTNSRDPGYGGIKVGANSTAVTAVTAQSSDVTLAAKTYNETYTFKPVNKWIMLQGTNSDTAGSDVINIGHALSAQTAGTFGSTDNQTPAHGATFNVPYLKTDAAGHVTEAGTKTVTLPADNDHRDSGYGQIKVGANSSAVTAVTSQASDVTIQAATYNELFTFKPVNKWVMLQGTNSGTAGSDVINIGHTLSGVTKGTYGSTSAQTPSYGGTFTVPYVTVDEAGHVTAAGTATTKIPAAHNGYGGIKVVKNSTAVTAPTSLTTDTTITAAAPNETFTFQPENKWVGLYASNSGTAGSDVIKIGHVLSSLAAGTYGSSSNQTPKYAATFDVPYLQTDAAGHVVAAAAKTVELPVVTGMNLLPQTQTLEGWGGTENRADTPFLWCFSHTIVGTTGNVDLAYNSVVTPKSNTWYTLSYWAKASAATTIRNYFYANTCVEGYNSQGRTFSSSSASDGAIDMDITTSWQKYWVSWKTGSSISGAKNIIIGRLMAKNGITFYTALPKLEEGKYVTDWTPNPGDGFHIYGRTGNTALIYNGGASTAADFSLVLHGNSTTGSSGIAFVSGKGNTAINYPSDRAFIQYHPYGIANYAAEGTAPTLATSGEAARLVIGVGNDAADELLLQTPDRKGLKHQVGNTNYTIPDTNNTTGSVGSATSPVYVDGAAIKPVDYLLEANVYYQTHNATTAGWSTMKGRQSTRTLSITRHQGTVPTWVAGPWSSSILFGGDDTKGMLSIKYDSPTIVFAGASTGNSTDDAPKWYFKISGTSGTTYTMPSDTKTIVGSNGQMNVNTGTQNRIAYYSSDNTISSTSAHLVYDDGIKQINSDTSNWTQVVKWDNTTTYGKSYLPGIGRHNTGDTTGVIQIIPYATDTSPWDNSEGLIVGSTYLRYNDGNFELKKGFIWVQGGSAAGSNTNRLTTTSGMPGTMLYNKSRRGTQIYANGIAFCDPYNGNTNNDAGWIRQIEETGNQGSLEIAVGDDGNEPIYVRQYNTSNAVKNEAILLSSTGATSFPVSVNVGSTTAGGIGLAQTNGLGSGISLYDGPKAAGAVEYGLFFGKTATFGTLGDVSNDWATYFTMNRNDTRGWIFKSNGGAANANNNVASISGRGHFTGTLTPTSWLDGQRYMSAAYNIADYSNTSSYNPWMRATNTWATGAENAKVGKWFSFGTLGDKFYWMGSTTTRTGNSYDHSLIYNISNGNLSVDGDLYIGLSSGGNRGIYYTGTKNTYEMITFLDNTADQYGNGIKIGGGGLVVIGAGESAGAINVSAGTEDAYLLADGNVFVEANANTAANRVGFKVDTGGHIVPVKAEANNNLVQNIGADGVAFKGIYAGNIYLRRQNSTAYGRVSFYQPTYRTWISYMSNSASGACPTGGQPATTTEVSSWAQRSIVENAAGYGWIWEAAAEAAAASATTKPTARMSLSSNTGQLRIEADASSSTTQKSALIISSNLNASNGNIALELWRGTNASWQIANEGGTLCIKDNYTTAAQSTYLHDIVKISYNTGLITNNGYAAGSGLQLNYSGTQYGKLYISALGTANSGNGNATQGAQGWAELHLGNATARPASGTAGGANNAAGNLRIYAANTSYTDIRSQGNGNRIFYLPNYAGAMYAVHASDNSAVGGARQPIYVAANGRVTAANYTVAHFGNAGKSNMNDVGRLHASSGMTNLTSTSNADTPCNGTTYSSGWHLYWSTNYSDDPNGTNAWVAQIVNKAGNNQWWVRSRGGGTITNGTAWASTWRHIVTSTEAAVGGEKNPIYINANGEATACGTLVNYAFKTQTEYNGITNPDADTIYFIYESV